ncbi:MAG: hypothetical protein AAF492_00955, partial [Verrucomicrobiota bacterium]
MTPVPRGSCLDAISALVLADMEEAFSVKMHADGTKALDRFADDQHALMGLPKHPYDVRKPSPISISRGATATVEGVLYSLPERWARLDAMAYVGVGDIRFICRGVQRLRERGRKGTRVILYRDYMRELSRKPQAVRQVAPELIAELGGPYGRLWALLQQTHGPQKGARILAGVLGAIDEHGEEVVTDALAVALAEGRVDLLAIGAHLPAAPTLGEALVPAALRSVHVESAQASDYDALLRGGRDRAEHCWNGDHENSNAISVVDDARVVGVGGRRQKL